MKKLIYISIATFLIGSLITGSVIYFLQESRKDENEKELEEKIDELEKKLSDSNDQIDDFSSDENVAIEDEDSATETAQTSSTKTCTSKDLNLKLKVPVEWKCEEIKGEVADWSRLKISSNIITLDIGAGRPMNFCKGDPQKGFQYGEYVVDEANCEIKNIHDNTRFKLDLVSNSTHALSQSKKNALFVNIKWRDPFGFFIWHDELDKRELTQEETSELITILNSLSEN